MIFDKAWVKFEISRLENDAANVLNYIDIMCEESHRENDRDGIIYYEEISDTLVDVVDALRIVNELL